VQKLSQNKDVVGLIDELFNIIFMYGEKAQIFVILFDPRFDDNFLIFFSDSAV